MAFNSIRPGGPPISRFRDSRDVGACFLLARMNKDGSYGDIKLGTGQYYKTVWALQCSGYSNEANRILDWVRRTGMTDKGDFGPRPSGPQDYDYTYHNMWIVIAAHRLGQLDIARRGMDFLTSYHDPDNGGFYSAAEKGDVGNLQDMFIVAFGGLAALQTGRLELARGTGKWFETVMNAQPNFPAQIYTVYSRDAGLHTKDTGGRYLVNAQTTVDQQFFQPGAAAAFLARLYQATGERRWLDLATEYMRFPENASDFLFKIVRAGKVGYAASILYTMTGQAKYRDMAIRIGHNLVALQSPEGWWTTVGGNAANIESTAERVAWMDEIDQAVGHLV
ncbi:MAG: hypothetical protein FJ319_11825 [SAR202 cluster bacterium]|nr:hypothetical protein [SAR202 cluster bacterium]